MPSGNALSFALAGVVRLLHYLYDGLSALLVFVGAKMLLADVYKLPVGVALGSSLASC
jgi:tellurite resistance protein TerC